MEIEYNGHTFAATIEHSEGGVLTCVLQHYKPVTETVETVVIRDVTREIENGTAEDGTAKFKKVTAKEEVILTDNVTTTKPAPFDAFKIYAEPDKRTLKKMCVAFIAQHKKTEKILANGSN